MKQLGHTRAIIENVYPELDCGKAPVKRIINEELHISADIFGDGHDKVDGVLLFRKQWNGRGKEPKWLEKRMRFEGNDHWSCIFTAEETGTYEYTIEAWVDHFTTWQHDLKKKKEADQDLKTEFLIGAEMLEETAARGRPGQKKQFQKWIKKLREADGLEAFSVAQSKEVSDLMYNNRDRIKATRYRKTLLVRVERKKALFSSWYEFFPRSTSPVEGEHGTLKDSQKILPEIAKMGFDVVYLPPIHPIGRSHRKGINNATTAAEGEPGSPWAIGAEEGGHKAIHPLLGNYEDFEALIATAKSLEMEIALDFAIQCAPDHPYVKEHPQWFKWRPDGTVQYAENPPKKYQDVLPVNFETEDWENLWQELKSIVEFWIDKGVRIFRVDNPHTKPFVFWEWLIAEINKKYDGIIFLAEAFTRPRVMEKLAKIGFTQSYTYFTWRNTKEEFIEYLTELTTTELREYFRPNFWPNTPDILPISLENKSEPAFIIRLILAATLSSNYGIYGPLFEFGLNEAYPGKEEYTRSEKYEVKHWDWSRSSKTKEVITLINKIRKENEALQTTYNLSFNEIDNPQLISYTKINDPRGNRLLIVVNLDPEYRQSGWVKVPLTLLGLPENANFMVQDLLTGASYNWQNEWNYIELHPNDMPAHIFRIET